MNKSIRAMNWKTGNDELSQTVEPSLQWQMIVDRNGATGDERADLEEQIELLKNITPEAQEIYFKQEADPRTDETLPGWNEIAEKHAPKPRTLIAFIDCTHPNEHPTMNGIHCNNCETTREPMNGFEKTLVSKLAPRDSGFVNYK